MKNKYKTLIISCWAVLLIYFVIKLLGGNYFEAICYNPHIVSVCDFIDNNYWISYLFKAPIYSFSSYFIYLIITKQKFKADWWLLLLFLPIPFIKKYLVVVGFILEFIIIIILPILILIKNKHSFWKSLLRVIIANVITIVFQFISIMTRNVGYYIPLDSTLIGIIMSIDYYLMIYLYYLYSNKKGVK